MGFRSCPAVTKEKNHPRSKLAEKSVANNRARLVLCIQRYWKSFRSTLNAKAVNATGPPPPLDSIAWYGL